MTAEREKKLRTTQRRMLRWMLRSFWRGGKDADLESEDGETTMSTLEGEAPEDDDQDETWQESWAEWMHRTTALVEDQLATVTPDDWVHAQRRRKWRLLGHVARRDDGRWSTAVLTWSPAGGRRKVGRPKKRFIDDVETFLKDTSEEPKSLWFCMAQERDDWKSLEEDFVLNSGHL